MDVAVGVGRAVVQDELGLAARGVAQAVIEIEPLPARQDLGSFCGSPARMGKSVLGRTAFRCSRGLSRS
jgi:hypothetical protein